MLRRMVKIGFHLSRLSSEKMAEKSKRIRLDFFGNHFSSGVRVIKYLCLMNISVKCFKIGYLFGIQKNYKDFFFVFHFVLPFPE